MNRVHLLLLLVFAYVSLIGQDSLPAKKYKLLPVPTFGYEPETSTYMGAVALATIYGNENTRSSNVSLEFTYTWKKQIIVETDWSFFTKEEKWFTKGLLHYSDYPDLIYYNHPHNSCPSCGLAFDSNRYIAEIALLRKIRKNIFGGINLRYHSYKNISGAVVDLYNTGPRLFARGIGVNFLIDTRDNILTASSGHYLDLNFQFNEQEFIPYRKLTVDLRKYFTLSDNAVMSCRLYGQFNSNRPPFFDEAIIGGDRYVRGFFYGRYRGHSMNTLQVEYRQAVVWRFAVSVFGGYSRTYGGLVNSNSGLLYNVGGGLRILVDKKEQTNLRLDYAIGQDGNSGFYFSFGESF